MVSSISNTQNNHSYLTEEQELRYLKEDCDLIVGDIKGYFAFMNALHSSGVNNAIKREISVYLRRVNTRVSISLLNELERTDFSQYCR